MPAHTPESKTSEDAAPTKATARPGWLTPLNPATRKQASTRIADNPPTTVATRSASTVEKMEPNPRHAPEDNRIAASSD